MQSKIVSWSFLFWAIRIASRVADNAESNWPNLKRRAVRLIAVLWTRLTATLDTFYFYYSFMSIYLKLWSLNLWLSAMAFTSSKLSVKLSDFSKFEWLYLYSASDNLFNPSPGNFGSISSPNILPVSSWNFSFNSF